MAFTSLTALTLGDPDRGGVLAAASVTGLLCGTPVALWAQRRSRPGVLLVAQLAVVAVAWWATALSVGLGGGLGTWLVLAFLAGAAMAGSAGSVRSVMGAVVPPPMRGRASTIDALAQDAVTFLAPVVVGVGVLLAGAPGAPVAVGVVAALAAVRAVGLPGGAAVPVVVEPVVAGRRKRLAWSSVSLALGLTLGAAEAGAVGLAVRLGLAVGSVWVLFLVLAVASALGVWLDVAVLQDRLGSGRFRVLVGVMVAGALLIAVGPSWATVLPGLVLIGLPTAALLGLRSHAFDADEPSESRAGLTLSFAAQSAGFAAGAALLSLLGQPGTLVVAAVLLAVSSALVHRLR